MYLLIAATFALLTSQGLTTAQEASVTVIIPVTGLSDEYVSRIWAGTLDYRIRPMQSVLLEASSSGMPDLPV